MTAEAYHCLEQGRDCRDHQNQNDHVGLLAGIERTTYLMALVTFASRHRAVRGVDTGVSGGEVSGVRAAIEVRELGRV